MSKINKLNISAVKSTHSKEFTQKKIIVNVGGKGYEVLVDEKFQITKIQKMVLEALNNYNEIKKIDEFSIISYHLFLIIKYFSDLDLAKLGSFEEQISLLNIMLDLELIEPIISAIPESEIKKVTDFMKKIPDRINEWAKENKTKEDIEKIIETEIKEEV